MGRKKLNRHSKEVFLVFGQARIAIGSTTANARTAYSLETGYVFGTDYVFWTDRFCRFAEQLAGQYR